MKRKLLFLMIAVLSITGCAGVTPPYSNSPENIQALRKLMNTEHKIRVGEFSGEDKSTMCRLDSSITPPGDVTFAEYFKEAFKQEFIIAGVYDEESPLELKGRVKNVAVDSVGTGTWDIEVEFQVTNHPPFVVHVSHPFRSAYTAYNACQNAKNSFSSAVQELILKTVTYPDFMAAVE